MLLVTPLLLVLVLILADVGERRPWLLALGVALAAWVGTTLPDLDRALGLGHRSGLTHGVLPALALGWRPQWRAVAAGLALGLSLHLAADVFPNAMRGYARVVLPGIGRLDAMWSWWWLGVNAVLALVAGAWLIHAGHPPRVARATLAAVGAIGILYLARTDGGWWVLAIVVAALGIGWAFGRRRRAV